MKKIFLSLVGLIAMMPVTVFAETSVATQNQLSETEMGIIIGSIVIVCLGLVVLSGKTRVPSKESSKEKIENRDEK